MTGAESMEYRIAHLQERLARGESAELGVRVGMRDGTVFLTGTAHTAARRDEILRIAREELAGIPVRSDLALAEATAPDHAEELP